MASEDVAGIAGETGQISRRRGRVFEALCFGATVVGIVTVVALLLYVANDAGRPFTADPRWYAVFVSTVAVPVVVLSGYYLARDRRAGEVAYIALGIPVVGLLVGGGLVVLFVEIVTPVEWFGIVVALLVGGGVVYTHRRIRPDAALERLGLLVVAPLVALVGVPSVAIDFTFVSPLFGRELLGLDVVTPTLAPSVVDLVTGFPVLPVDWMVSLVTVVLPVALVAGWHVGERRESRRGGTLTIALSLLAGAGAAFAGPLIGLSAVNAVLVFTTTAIPFAVFAERVLRLEEGVSGFVLPITVGVGLLAGVLLVDALGYVGPASWLDWQFLTSAHSRDPSAAGIYPALVGSVLMLVVILVGVFPVGVGAAIYLEEYAPATGRLGAFVTLIEINIGNLAGVPSVVYGLLGLALFIRGVGLASGIVIVGGLTVGLLVLPIVIIAAQEAIRSVPDSMREASYGMGATKWQTTRNVVLPEALPGILTGTILALGRAIGETAPLLMVGVAAVVRTPPDGFFSRFSAMPRQIFTWSSEIQAEFRYGVLAAGVITLLSVLLLMNGSAIVIRNRYQRRN